MSDLIRQLAATVHPSESRKKPLALLKAYFDESGIHAGAKFTAMAGFVAPALKWISFEKAWNKRLKADGLPYFHMTECVGGYGIYRKLSEEKRARLIEDLSDAICDHDLVAVVTGVAGKDWDAVINPDFKKHFPKPYNFCFEQCLQDVHNWNKYHPKRDKVALVFAEQTEYRDRSQMIFGAYAASRYWGRFQSFTFVLAKKMAALQAADMLVYEIYRAATDNAAGEIRPVSLKFVMRNIKFMGRMHTRETIQEIADAGAALRL